MHGNVPTMSFILNGYLMHIPSERHQTGYESVVAHRQPIQNDQVAIAQGTWTLPKWLPHLHMLYAFYDKVCFSLWEYLIFVTCCSFVCDSIVITSNWNVFHRFSGTSGHKTQSKLTSRIRNAKYYPYTTQNTNYTCASKLMAQFCLSTLLCL